MSDFSKSAPGMDVAAAFLNPGEQAGGSLNQQAPTRQQTRQNSRHDRGKEDGGWFEDLREGKGGGVVRRPGVRRTQTGELFESHTNDQTDSLCLDRHTRQTPGNDHTTTDTDTFGATVTEVLGSLSGSSGSATWPDPDGHPEMAHKNGTAATTYSTPPCSRRSSVALIQSGAVPVPSAIRNASFLLCREIVRFFAGSASEEEHATNTQTNGCFAPWFPSIREMIVLDRACVEEIICRLHLPPFASLYGKLLST